MAERVELCFRCPPGDFCLLGSAGRWQGAEMKQLEWTRQLAISSARNPLASLCTIAIRIPV